MTHLWTNFVLVDDDIQLFLFCIVFQTHEVVCIYLKIHLKFTELIRLIIFNKICMVCFLVSWEGLLPFFEPLPSFFKIAKIFLISFLREQNPWVSVNFCWLKQSLFNLLFFTKYQFHLHWEADTNFGQVDFPVLYNHRLAITVGFRVQGQNHLSMNLWMCFFWKSPLCCSTGTGNLTEN